MSVRYLGLVLLVGFPGVLHAQSPAQSCDAPKLDNGYLVPNRGTYSHATKLTYACDMGYKPAVEGWWAKITCQNGNWSHVPKCINNASCIPPEIPNGNYQESPNGWYEDGKKLWIKCDEGYEHKDYAATTKCTNGKWSSVPVCQKKGDSCGVPPEIPHATIIGQGYKEVFAANSEVQYECKDGYTAEGAEKKFICIGGTWAVGPTCSKGPEPGTGQGGSAEVRPSERPTTSTGGTCILPAGEYVQSRVKLSQDEILKEGDTKHISCIWISDPHQSRVQCIEGRITLSNCCRPYEVERGSCRYYTAQVV